MLDTFERRIDYLRISVTDRCNLRCVYCMPEEGVLACSHEEILRYEEILQVVRAAVGLGIHKFRLTGGEPLARLGLVDFVGALARISGVDDLAMTTNGTLLAPMAADLAAAGLSRVNISLDTLRPERFREITRRGRLEDVLAGIEAAKQAGLTPVKINTVVVRDVNDDEVVDLARRALDEGWHLRFIEWMPVGSGEVIHRDWRSRVVTAAEIREQIEAELGSLTLAAGLVGAGPATSYHVGGSDGTIGFIPAISEHFCDHCNRLRLTADGKLRPCLLSDSEIDLRQTLRAGATPEVLQALILQAVGAKPQAHCLAEDARAEVRTMAQIGGMMMTLTHLDEAGHVRMVDVGGKPDTERLAIARGDVLMQPATLRLIVADDLPKGDVLTTAQVAGIMAAKRTADLIPLCHPLALTKIDVAFEIDAENSRIMITATVRTRGKTGVEMEALTAVSVAALTIYDMAKAVEKGMRITNIRLVRKEGGKSGTLVLEDRDED